MKILKQILEWFYGPTDYITETERIKYFREFQIKMVFTLCLLFVVFCAITYSCQAQDPNKQDVFKTAYISHGEDGKPIDYTVKWVYDETAQTLAFSHTDSLHSSNWRHPIVFNSTEGVLKKMVLNMGGPKNMIPLVIRYDSQDDVYINDHDIPRYVVIQWGMKSKPVYYFGVTTQ